MTPKRVAHMCQCKMCRRLCKVCQRPTKGVGEHERPQASTHAASMDRAATSTRLSTMWVQCRLATLAQSPHQNPPLVRTAFPYAGTYRAGYAAALPLRWDRGWHAAVGHQSCVDRGPWCRPCARVLGGRA